MKLTLFLFLSLFFSLWFSAAPARENKDLVRANYYYAHYAYYEAIPYFEKITEQLNDPVIYSRLADCYSVTDHLQKAADTYAKAVTLPGCSDVVVLRYAQLLMQLAQYGEAEKWLKKYLESNKDDTRAANLVAGCETAGSMMQAIPQGIAVFLPFNTDGSDFAPALWNGNVVFASDTSIDTKKKTDNWTGKSYYNIYSIACNNKGQCGNDFNKLTETKQLNNKYHDGPCTFSADGKQMYFTRSRYNDNFFRKSSVSNKDSVVLLEIMVATDFDTASKKFKTITPFEYNSKDYSVAHPSVSPDGKVLAFSSTMPKGYGGSDIYLCKKQYGKWSKPQNAGSVINTEGEEVFPYWADDSTLFFSSDGHKGLGGLDIYKSTWNERSNTFSTPENAGIPINSSYDDISLALYADGRSSYFSSNRPAAKGSDNIYFFRKEKIFLQLNIVDSETQQPLAGATVSLAATNHKTDTTADNNGQLFTQLYPEIQYNVSIHKVAYQPKQLIIDATGEAETDTIFRIVKLAKIPAPPRAIVTATPPEPIIVRNPNIMDTPGIRTFELYKIYEIGHFYYEYNQSNLTGAHKVFLDTLLTQLNRHPTMHIEIRSHTDCRGGDAYNKVLSNNRALSVVNYLVEHGIPRRRLTYIGLGYSEPTIKCPVCEQCTEEQHHLNRLLEFKVLQL